MAGAWNPELDRRGGPLYRAIADAIERDIAKRTLAHGMQMPTHRALADRLGVNVATVTRAYAEAKGRGLLVGEVGRGTYVNGALPGGPAAEAPAPATPALARATGRRDVVDFRINQPPTAEVEKALMRQLLSIAERTRGLGLLDYQHAPGILAHRAAGAKWVARAGVVAEPERIVVTNGAQQALMATFAVLTQPGNLVLTEAVTYSGIRGLAELFRVRLAGLSIDDRGLLPEAFEAACRKERPAALYLTPTIHNPTAATLPAERRRQIARIAEAFEVPIVEDDIYGPLAGGDPAPIHTLSEGECYYVCGTSKTVAPGLRIGYLVAPPAKVRALANAVYATTWSTPPLTAEIVTAWIESGVAERMLAWHRAESARRQAAAREILGGFDILAQPIGYHLWLRLPPDWRGNDFVAAANANGAALPSSSPFSVDPSATPRAVRLSLGLPESQARMEEGLRRVADTLRRHSLPKSVVV